MTLSQIAELANVSVSTVSKAFADSSEISIDTKELIFKIARDNNCFEKYYKGKYSKKVIAVICPEIQSEFYYKIVTELECNIRKRNAVMVVSIYNFDDTIKKELFEYHAFIQKADGIVILGSPSQIVNKSHVPAVAFFTPADKSSDYIDTITFDMNKHIHDTVTYLCENGHTHIGYIGEQKTTSKYEDFVSAMTRNGLSVNDAYIKISNTRFEDAGYTAMSELIDSGNLPTAIFCAYDYIALGAIKCAREHGLKIPDDLSIIGSDGITVGAYLETPLTSISIDSENVCETAIEILMKKIDNKYLNFKQEHPASGGLIKRASVKNLNLKD